jgi:pimeloyl-ACP methyl ester carboxylesterase
MAYAQYGAPDGFPVVNCHGGLVCRFDVAAADAIATQAGIRLISPDRPGVGRSDPQPDRTILGWTDDVVQLLDSLDIDRCAAMGWSMGGQYAAALGYAVAPRVTRIAIIAGALPLTEPGVFADLPAMDRFLTRVSERTPWLARLVFRATRSVAGIAPERYGRFAAAQLGPTDEAVVREIGFATFSRMSRENSRQLAGAVEEYRAWARPWGFTPEDITAPVDVWAGVDDQLVKPDWARRLAARIPNAALHIRDGGHFVAHRHYREIFARLNASVSG